MCGILGWIGNIDPSNFLKALHQQNHRGPDDSGYQKVGNHINLGHTRLSIIDLNTNAKQPMTAGNGNLTAIFNGEIYNYRELRQKLESAGYIFKTDGDTEVLINAWDHWGQEALSLFIGMFAFAIYCHKSCRLWIVRDRFGVKPLYFYKKNEYFGFASEAKSLLSLMPSTPQLNTLAVNAYFSFRYPLTQDSFFNEIQQLPPGHLICRSKNGDCQMHRYYKLAEHIHTQIDDTQDITKIAPKIRQLFQSAVESQMVADVPIGTYLSGGVDSSAIVAAMSSASSKQVQTFTIGFEQEGFNEFSDAEKIARQFNTNHHSILISSEDYITGMDTLIRFKDAPLGVPNEIPLYKMSQVLKNYITVVLSGEGADEIFGGYGRLFRSADDYSKLKNLWNKNISADSLLGKRLILKYGSKHFANELDHFLWLYRYIDIDQYNLFSEELVSPDLKNRLTSMFKAIFDECPQSDYASKMIYCFQHLHLPGLLQRVDTSTMSVGVEARVPFVDHRLVEAAFSLPMSFKLAWKNKKAYRIASMYCGDDISEQYDIPKAVLKQAFANELPKEILYKRKIGFPAPLNGQLRLPLNHLAVKCLPDGLLVQRRMIHQKKLIHLLSIEKPTNQQSTLIWMLTNLELFMQAYF